MSTLFCWQEEVRENQKSHKTWLKFTKISMIYSPSKSKLYTWRMSQKKRLDGQVFQRVVNVLSKDWHLRLKSEKRRKRSKKYLSKIWNLKEYMRSIKSILRKLFRLRIHSLAQRRIILMRPYTLSIMIPSRKSVSLNQKAKEIQDDLLRLFQRNRRLIITSFEQRIWLKNK